MLHLTHAGGRDLSRPLRTHRWRAYTLISSSHYCSWGGSVATEETSGGGSFKEALGPPG